MSELTKQQLTVENNSSFPNNNTGFITPTLLRTFNGNIIDSMVDEVTYNADSASWTSDITALEQFSSSLSTNFVTPTQLSASSSTLQNNINTKLNTSSFNAYTASVVTVTTGSLLLTASAVNNVITFTKGDGSTFPITVATGSGGVSGDFVTTASFNTYTSSAATNTSASINSATSSISASLTLTDNSKLNTGSFNTYTASVATQIALLGAIKLNSASFNTYTSSNDSKVNSLIAATGSYITSAQTSSMTVLSASFALTASQARNVVVTATNGNASTLGVGTVVRITGANGDNPVFNSASWDNDSTSANALGILQSSVVSGATGSIVVTGVVIGVDTQAFTAGDVLYLSASGQFTNVQPQAPKHIVTLGEVLRVQQNNGSIFVNISNGWELDELHNVAINSVVDGDLLVYRSGTSLWTNSSSAELGLLNSSSFNSYTASASTNVSGAINTATGSSIVTASISGQTITFTKGNGSTFPILVPTGSGGGTIDTGSFATTGSNTFKGTQTIDLSATAIVTASAIIGNANAVITDMYVNGGNFDTFNVLVSASNGVFLRDFNGVDTLPFLSVDTNGGNVRIPRNTNITGSLNVSASFGGDDGNLIRGGVTIVGGNNGNAITIPSGSVSVVSPQGTGFFYSNLPITSSGLRINGTALVNDLIVSGVFGGNSSLQVLGNASISGTLTLSSSAAVELSVIGGQSNSGSIAITGSAPTQLLTSGGLTLSGSLLSNVTDIYTGSNNANFIVTLGSASMASLLAAGTTNPNTLYFVI